MNVTLAGFADDRTRWAGPDAINAEGFENLVAFQKRLRRDDLSLTHTIIHPTVDKARDANFAENPVPLHKVGETAHSIVVRGCRCSPPSPPTQMSRRSTRPHRFRPARPTTRSRSRFRWMHPVLCSCAETAACGQVRTRSTRRSPPASTRDRKSVV